MMQFYTGYNDDQLLREKLYPLFQEVFAFRKLSCGIFIVGDSGTPPTDPTRNLTVAKRWPMPHGSLCALSFPARSSGWQESSP